MADHDITLYYFPVSPPARSVLYLLDFFENTSVKRQVVNLVEGEHVKPEFLALNPHHTVPTLEDKTTGVVLYESTAILQYLAEVFGWDGKYGLPKDVKGKFTVINALHKHHNFVAATTGKVMGHVLASIFVKAPFDLDAFKQSVADAKPTWAALDAQLAKNGGFIAGSSPTIADLRVWSDLFQLSNAGGDLTSGIIDFAEYENITKYLAAIKADLYTDEKWAPLDFMYSTATAATGSDAFRLTRH